MKEQDEKRLRELKRHLSVASIIADELSRKVKDFIESKPLNILYKEINALHYAVSVMLDDIKIDKKDINDKNMNFLWRVPDCLKIFMNMKKEE